MILTNVLQNVNINSMIGVIGTLAGVTLGWGLSTLSNIGKLYFNRQSVYIDNYKFDTESVAGKVKVLSG